MCYKKESEFEKERDEQVLSMRRAETESKGIGIRKEKNNSDVTGFASDDEQAIKILRQSIGIRELLSERGIVSEYDWDFVFYLNRSMEP